MAEPVYDLRAKLLFLYQIYKDKRNKGEGLKNGRKIETNEQLGDHFNISGAAIAYWINGQRDTGREGGVVPNDRIPGLLDLFGLPLSKKAWLTDLSIEAFEEKVNGLEESSWDNFLPNAPQSKRIEITQGPDLRLIYSDEDRQNNSLIKFAVGSPIKISVSLDKAWSKLVNNKQAFATIITRDANSISCICPHPSKHAPRPELKYDLIRLPVPSPENSEFLKVESPTGIQSIYVILTTTALSKELVTLILDNTTSLHSLEKSTLDKLATEILNKGQETEILSYSYNVVPAANNK